MNDYFDLGNYSRTVSDNKNSQSWFDRGMVWLFAYNHEEAISCFEKAIEADQKCAFAYWGIAYAVGPCLLYTSPSPRDRSLSRMPSSA